MVTREELVARLAAVSHATWMRQKERDQGVPRAELSTEVTEHDRERAEDAVAELERLGVWRWPQDELRRFGRGGRVRAKDAGRAKSSAPGPTEDSGSCRPACPSDSSPHSEATSWPPA